MTLAEYVEGDGFVCAPLTRCSGPCDVRGMCAEVSLKARARERAAIQDTCPVCCKPSEIVGRYEYRHLDGTSFASCARRFRRDCTS